MARGWESKSVESQQFEAPVGAGWRQRPSAEELERAGKRESLELSRRRVVNELAGARSEVHRTALQNALRHLDAELARLR